MPPERLLEEHVELALAGAEDEREAFRQEKRGVQDKGADGGALAGWPAAVEGERAIFGEYDVAMPAVNSETPSAKNRAGFTDHGRQLPRVHGGYCGVAAGEGGGQKASPARR